MFTIEQIKAAHSKVKSGADFPNYVQELKTLGVICYDNYVADGHTDYYGPNQFKASGGAKYPVMQVSDTASFEKLRHAITIHQLGQTDYITVCKHAAEAGVEKWTVDIIQMTCTYYDKTGNNILVEEIPNV